MWNTASRYAGGYVAELRHTAPAQAADSLFPQVSAIR
jgi:hypothetical protein